MNPEDDDREPIEVLYAIEEKVEASNGGRVGTDSDELLSGIEPRMNADPGTKRYPLLRYVSEHGPVTVEDCERVVGSRTASTLTDLWNAYFVNRAGTRGNYKYTITPIGELALEKGQQHLSDGERGEDESPSRDPWVVEGIKQTEYHALRALRDIDGHPTTKEMNDLFIEYSGASKQKGSSYAVTPRMSCLYEAGYVDRTPDMPYVYWLTDKGRDALSN